MPTPASVVIIAAVAGLGIVRERSSLLLEFNAIRRPEDPAPQPMKARLRMVDNARESVDEHGRIRGIRATGTIANRASGMASSIALFDPLMFAWARASSVALLRFSNPEIACASAG